MKSIIKENMRARIEESPISYVQFFTRALLIIALAAFFVGCRKQTENRILAAGIVDGDVIIAKAAASGKVLSAHFEEGQPVAREGLLLEIDTDKLINNLEGIRIRKKEIPINRAKLNRKIELLKTSRTYWTDQVKRFERLKTNDAVSGDELEKARLKLDEVDAALYEAEFSLRALSLQNESLDNQSRQIELTLQDFTVLSPVKGVILEKFITPGETVFPGSPIAEILDTESLFIETFLEGEEISRLKLEQPVRIHVDGISDHTYEGRIKQFGSKAEFSPKYIISEKERRALLYRVKIGIEQEPAIFKLGMPVTIKIE